MTRWVFLALVWCAMLPGMAKDPEERMAFQRNDPPAVTVMFTDGSEAVDLLPNRKLSLPYVTPALAPNGTTLVFSALAGTQHKLYAWRLDEHNAAVGDPKRLTPETTEFSEQFPAWSPDGKQLAFLATDKSARTSLCLINADGSGLTVLATVAYAAYPAWSPDSKQLLYIDLMDGKPVLFTLPASGGKGIAIRPDSRIIAACYSPDGKQIAALVEQDPGVTDLYILPPFGIGGRPIVRNILGARGILWRPSGTIIFNAAKVGALGGKSFWFVHANGTGLRGVTGYADPKQVAYFSLERCDLTPYVPVAVVPIALPEMPTETVLPIEEPEEPQEPAIIDQLALHAVTIVSPLDGATVQGVVPVRMVSRKDVASVSLLIGGQFAYSIASDGSAGPVPTVRYSWDTQAFREINPADGLPRSYEDHLRYPDGAYTICVQALDAGGTVIDQHIITVNVQNTLSDGALPGNTARVQYRYNMQTPREYFRIHGEGELIGAAPGQASELRATLDAAFRRILQKPLTNGSYPFRTEICGPDDRWALTFGAFQASLPEFASSSSYTVSPQGDLAAGTQESTPYIPLTQLAVPVPETPVKIGDHWEKPMWIVADLLDREASLVQATHTLDGVEWIEGKRTVRIRSAYRLDSALSLRTVSSTTLPGLRGSREMQLTRMPATGATRDPNTPVNTTIDVWKASGVRYAWFDVEGQRLLRVDDQILYTILKRNLPPATQPMVTAGDGGSGQGTTAWYLVQYRYNTYVPAIEKQPTKK